MNQAIGGALSVFEASQGIEVVPAIGARSGSAGLLSAAGWKKLSTEIMDQVRARIDQVDAVYFSLHGAMGADGELDPEGWLLEQTRALAGNKPIVISLDLHGILTDRMLRQIDGLAIYWTYPHVDFFDTGRRAAELLLRIMDRPVKPTIARVVIPALVRGDELITKNGCYGDLLRECQRLEAEGTALAAGIMIGNPFTDVPELCSQVLVMTDGDAAAAEREATRLAQEFWPLRFRMQGKLIALDRAIAQAKSIDGPVIFTDAADATSSGASGDSNAIIKALRDAGYRKRVLAPIVDAPAARAAHEAGVGARDRGRARRIGRSRALSADESQGARQAAIRRRGAARDHEGAAAGGADRGPHLRELHRAGDEPLGQPVRSRDVFRQRARPDRLRSHRRQVAAHRASHVRCLEREELQRRCARRHLGQSEEPRTHDLRAADLSARRERHVRAARGDLSDG